MLKPVTAWCTVGPNGELLPDTVRRRRSDAIQAAEDDNGDNLSWYALRKYGWRVVKVTLTAADAALSRAGKE